MSDAFVDCILQQLKSEGFDPKKSKELEKRYEGLAKGFQAEGESHSSAYLHAQKQLFEEVRNRRLETLRQKVSFVNAYNDGVARMDAALASGKTTGLVRDLGYKSRGAYVGAAILSKWVNDPAHPGVSWEGQKGAVFGDIVSQIGEALFKYGRGFMGTQKGIEEVPNIMRAAFGEVVEGSPEAVAFGRALQDAANSAVASLRRVGGNRGVLDNFMPDPMISGGRMYEMERKGELLAFVKSRLDLAGMRRPDGSPLPLKDTKELDKILAEALRTKMEGGGSSAGGGGGQQERHRFFKWKNADAWMEVEKALGFNDPMHTWFEHFRGLADEIARETTVGSNSSRTLRALIAEGRKKAAKLGEKDLAAFDHFATNQLVNVDNIMRGTAVPDPRNRLMLFSGLMTNLAKANLLKYATLITVPTDQVNTHLVRAVNHLGSFADMMSVERLVFGSSTEEVRRLALEGGYIIDSLVSPLSAPDRFGAATLAEHAPVWSQKLVSAVMRANWMTGSTERARTAALIAFRQAAAKSWIGKSWNEMAKFHGVLQRYGISEKEWVKISPLLKAKEVDTHPGVHLFDASGVKEAGDLQNFYKLEGLFHQEAMTAVPEGNARTRNLLTKGHKPDTLVGALLTSFAQFKSMAFAVPQIMAQQIAALEGSGLKKATYVGATLAALTLMGALKMQLQEVVGNQRTPRKMDPEFWARATLQGGAFGFLGDTVFGTLDSVRGRGINDMLAGAMSSQVGVDAKLLGVPLAEGYKYALGEEDAASAASASGHAIVEFMKQNTPATFYTYPIVNGWLYNELDRIVDPDGNARRARQAESMARRQKGNEPLQFK